MPINHWGIQFSPQIFADTTCPCRARVNNKCPGTQHTIPTGYIEELEQERLINADTVAREAIIAVESDGIVFIDEIDKIVSSAESRHGKGQPRSLPPPDPLLTPS
eukprot:8948299-Pyramimonas_sp.AAC.1